MCSQLGGKWVRAHAKASRTHLSRVSSDPQLIFDIGTAYFDEFCCAVIFVRFQLEVHLFARCWHAIAESKHYELTK